MAGNDKIPKLIGIGESDVDLFYRVKKMPGKGEKARAEEVGKMAGGIVGNFCSQAAKMGVPCGMVSVVGGDAYGDFLLKDYEERGIDTKGIYIEENEKTFYCIVFLDESGEKYLSAVVSPLTSPDTKKIDYDYVRQAEFVHLCSMDYHLAAYTVEKLQKGNTKISLDYESHAQNPGIEYWGKIFSGVSVLFTNEEGISQLFPDMPLDKAAGQLLETGPETVVITCAEKGGYVYTPEKSFRYYAYQADRIRDTTGAGDSFNGAFLACLINGMEPEAAAERAAAAAAFVIQKEGARTGQADLKEIEAFIQSQPQRIR